MLIFGEDVILILKLKTGNKLPHIFRSFDVKLSCSWQRYV